MPVASGTIDPGELAIEHVHDAGCRLLFIAIEDRRVVALGDQLLASTNGAQFYRRAHPGSGTRALVIDEGVIVVCGDNVFARSRDLGASWKQLDVPVRPGWPVAICRTRGVWWLAAGSVVMSSLHVDKGWRKAPVQTSLASQLIELDDVLVVGEGRAGYGMWNGTAFRKLELEDGYQAVRFVKCPDGSWLAIRNLRTVWRSTDRGASFEPMRVSGNWGFYEIQDCAWVAGALFVIAQGSLYRWMGDRFANVPTQARRLSGIASWGDGALLCSESGQILRFASPRDPYWADAVDELAPVLPPIDPPPASRTPAELREEVFEDLLREAVLMHEELSATRRAARPRSELEQLVDEAPDDDPSALRVYADALHAEGDPRAELAAVQLAIEDDPSDELREVERELLGIHAEHVLGKLIPGLPHLELTWRAGFLRRVRTHFTWAHAAAHAVETLAALLDEPSGRFLRELVILGAPKDNYSPLASAIGARYLPALRALVIDESGPDRRERPNTRLELEPIYTAMPNLRALSIRVGHLTLGEITLPHLERFELATGSLVGRAAKAIASARWPSLRSLAIQVGAWRRGGTAKLKDLRPIFHGARLPRLTHLAVTNHELSDDLVEMLGTSQLLAQLEVLDLRNATLSDAGAAILYRHQHAYAHLRTIRLDDNILTAAGIALLESTGLPVALGRQRQDPGTPELRVLP